MLESCKMYLNSGAGRAMKCTSLPLLGREFITLLGGVVVRNPALQRAPTWILAMRYAVAEVPGWAGRCNSIN